MINERRQRLLYVTADFISTFTALVVYNVVRYYLLDGRTMGFSTLWSFLSTPTLVIEQILFPIVMLGVYGISGYYNNVFQKSRLQEFLNTATVALIGTVIFFFAILVNDIVPTRRFLFELIVPLYFSLFVIVYIPRYLITDVASTRFENGKWGFNTLIVGTSQAAQKFDHRLSTTRNKTGIRIVGYVDISGDENPEQNLNHPVYPLADVERVCKELGVRRLVVVPHRHGMRATTELISKLFPIGIPIMITADVHQLIAARPRMTNVASDPVIDISSSGMAASTANIKRLSDVVISFFTLLIIAPIIGVLAILIKRDSPGPVFYKQERIGYKKKPFTIYKLRSMRMDAESSGPALSTLDDPRITPIGKIMRKYRLDELPQFWNVLKGDMSLVGPRPEREYYIKQIIRRVPYYTLVHQVRPGITSWGMVKYGYASSVDEMVERLSYDLLYIENVSFVIDIKILIYTIRTVLTGKGI